MSRRFAMIGPASGEPLSYEGRILVHSDRAELEFLCPGVRVVELGSQTPDVDTLPIQQHPDLTQVRWPLRREDFA